MLEVVPVHNRRLKNRFIQFPWKIYRDDPYWVPPLLLERKRFLDPRKNPFFRYGRAELFMAFQNGEPVGRISAHVIPRHNELYHDKTGFFGFFESIDDPDVAGALFRAAGDWLKGEGRDRILGPMSFTIKDEIGVLVDGFDSPPYILNGHSPRYYPALIESCGFKKVKDWFAWRYTVGDLSPGVIDIAEQTRRYPGLQIRSLDMKRFHEEVRLLVSLFNEIWADNWGFIPFSEEEGTHLAEDLRPIIDPEMIFFATVNGEPAGFGLTLPNVNELLRSLDGRLSLRNWPKLLRAIWRPKWRTARVFALGIRKPYRGTALGNLSVLLYVETHQRGVARGYQEGELSLTLEDNEKINNGITLMGGRRYKIYRLYEKAL